MHTTFRISVTWNLHWEPWKRYLVLIMWYNVLFNAQQPHRPAGCSCLNQFKLSEFLFEAALLNDSGTWRPHNQMIRLFNWTSISDVPCQFSDRLHRLFSCKETTYGPSFPQTAILNDNRQRQLCTLIAMFNIPEVVPIHAKHV